MYNIHNLYVYYIYILCVYIIHICIYIYIYICTRVCVCVYVLEKGMATHSIILVWRIPWTEECGGLQSMVSQRVKYD